MQYTTFAPPQFTLPHFLRPNLCVSADSSEGAPSPCPGLLDAVEEPVVVEPALHISNAGSVGLNCFVQDDGESQPLADTGIEQEKAYQHAHGDHVDHNVDKKRDIGLVCAT